MTVIRPLLYIAAPYTRPDPVINTHRAARVGMIIYHEGTYAPVVPHLSLLWHAITPQPIDVWYDIDLSVLAHCQAIVRLPGESAGADAEVDFAEGYVFRGIHPIAIIDFVELSEAARMAWHGPL